MSVLTILVGLPSSLKSAVAEDIRAAREARLFHTDQVDVRLQGKSSKERHAAVFQTLKPSLIEPLQNKQAIVLDGVNRTPAYRKPYLDLARQYGYEIEAVFVDVTLENALELAALSERDLRRQQRNLQVPTLAEAFDRVDVRTPESVISEAADFFAKEQARLLSDPVGLIRELEKDGRLELWLPELHRAIPIDQHNPHHRFTIYEHILKATEVIAGTSLKMVWTMLLHDIGKAYPGIKQFTGTMVDDFQRWKKKDRVIIENGADIREGRDDGTFYVVDGTRIPEALVKTDLVGHFYEHENLGAQMAYRILQRFGYPAELARDVMTLIQFHMLLPYDIDTASLASIRKWYEKVGPYAPELMLVRLADSRGK